MSTDLKTSSISIIIPTCNEEENIGSILPELIGTPDVELLVVDGGSTDQTVDVADSLGAKVLVASPGRAVQMNTGAEAASNAILLFLHADTRLPSGFAEQVRDTLSRQGVAAGAFSLAINGKGIGLRILEWLINFRSRILQMPYGDQGIFIAAEMFNSAGRFPVQPIMEDYELVRKLKRRGAIRILPLRATTSVRRWERLGVLKTTLINQAIILGYLFGAKPEKLTEWYNKW